MGSPQKPGETPNRPGEYEERGPRGGRVPSPRPGDDRGGGQAPTSDLGEGSHLGADRSTQAIGHRGHR